MGIGNTIRLSLDISDPAGLMSTIHREAARECSPQRALSLSKTQAVGSGAR